MKRVLRILEYVGDERFIKTSLDRREVKGSMICNSGVIREYLTTDPFSLETVDIDLNSHRVLSYIDAMVDQISDAVQNYEDEDSFRKTVKSIIDFNIQLKENV